jgi:transmembrane sensor
MSDHEELSMRLGRQVGAELGEHEGEAADLERARARFLVSARAERRPIPRRRAGWAIGLSLAAAVLTAVVLLSRSPALSFQVGTEGARGEPGAWIAAPLGQPLDVRFSDGTSFALEPSSRARVVSVESEGARIVLERGRAHFEVRPRAHARWQIDVGPFEVHVTGTSFDVGWDPATEAFELRLAQGSVALSGPLVGERRPVRAGQTARVAVAQGKLEILDTAAAAASAQAAAAGATPSAVAEMPGTRASAGDAAEHPAAPEPRASAGSMPGAGGNGPGAGWRELAAVGDYKQALGAAKAAGFERLCDSLSANDLSRLADAARLAGDVGSSADAYQALRRRFPRDPRAALAAFSLGKMDFDQRGAYASAAQWFAAYLAEQPDGALAQEAAGRRLEALHRAKDEAGARVAAAAYLRRYPDGPHAALARELAGD